MSSKALALLVTGLNTLGDGLKMMAAELQEGYNESIGVVASGVTKTEEKKTETKKEAVKETKTEAAPEIDEAKLREECTALVKEAAAALKKPAILEALKKVGATKVTDCPAAKLLTLKTALEAIKVS